MTTINTIRSVNDFADDAVGQHQLWKAEIEAARKELQVWHKRSEKIIKIYLDNRTLTDTNDRNFNLFAANTSILRASLYSRIPKPTVTRRFNDYDDDVSRVAAIIMERAISFELDNDHEFDSVARAIIDDRLLSGLGTAWVRYDTERDKQLVQISEEVEDTESEPTEVEIIIDEHTPIDYVHWKDFFWSPARTWAEVRWVARRVYMSRDEIAARFGEGAEQQVQFSDEQDTTTDEVEPRNKVMQQGEVFEVWDKTSGRVIWLATYGNRILDEKEDPLGLPGFFPCPKPLIANATTSNLIPLPDYTLVQDQYAELNELNNRISHLVSACKVAGVYDAEAKQVRELLTSGKENVLIPVDRWAAYAERGGMAKQIEWLPIEQIANVLQTLQQARDVIKSQIYELTGISDVIRGVSSQYETAKAQQIKAQYASLRLAALQGEVANFFSELVAKKAHLMAKYYEPERLLVRAGQLSEADQQLVMPALELLKNELLSHFRVFVSVDSLQMPNFDTEKEQRTEAIGAISSFLQTALPAAKESPQLAPMLMGLLKWGISGYKASAEIEGMLDRSLAQLQAEQGQPQQQPDPAAIAAQAEQQKAQAELQIKQAELQLKQTQIQNDFAIRQAELLLEREKIALKREELQQNAQVSQFEAQADAVIKERNLEIKRETAQLNAANQANAIRANAENNAVKAEIAVRGQNLQALNTSNAAPNSPA